MRKLTFIIYLIIGSQLFCQNEKLIDSLKRELNLAKEDSTKVKLKTKIGEESWLFRISYWDSIVEEANHLKMHKEKAHALNNIGFILKNRGRDFEAIKYFEQSVESYKAISNQIGIAETYNNLAEAYTNLGQIEKALDYHNQSLKIKEETGDKDGIANSLNNMGLVYYNQNEAEKALEFHKKAYLIKKELKNLFGEGTALNNIGLDFYALGKIDSALFYFQKSLEKQKEGNSIQGVNLALNNIAGIYRRQKRYDEALIFYLEVLNIRDSINDIINLPQSYSNLSQTYYSLGNLSEAKKLAEKGLEIAQKINRPSDIEYAAKGLYMIYKKLGDTEKALQTYELYILMRDSIRNEKTQKATVRSQMLVEFEKEKLILAKEQEKKDILHSEAQKRKNIIIIAASFGLILLLAFLYFLNKRFQLTRKQKLIIEAKNKEITDSINYAKRIQAAILPPIKTVKEFLPNSFILYKPKDIVAGDFYWLEHKDGKVLFAAADCTGHGVPGAMVSVVCNNGLNRSVREHDLTEPGKILDKTREIIITEFEKSEEEVKDGMDIALCSLEGSKLQYAGANNPLWIIRNGEILEIKADKQPIGKYAENKPYTTHNVEVQKGDSIYIFTDGYADQFGGEKSKKFKAANFKKLLLSIQEKPMEEQKDIIDQTFKDWKGNLEQIDDVCVIGVKI
jgi:serine phosphatase RsbU (regulator of sigma subunit)/Tfp pilus assembly protein PilF